jgi:UDP-N-acetylglucosamine--N-acetylmuramyl-(pentapeptide) pyrophosphoryl-undecaprenol N-acetylglucosamine transferase
MKNSPRIIVSGGGTGGHIFPAIAIANAIKQFYPDAAILFVGAEGRMEMQKVPQAGYEIIGLRISGIQRSLSAKNFLVPIHLLGSLIKARKIIRDFKPDVAVGVGGYASGPLLFVAGLMGIPTLIQEQNSYAGLTNKWLAKRAKRICVAYTGMERFFPMEKIVITGNPVRGNIVSKLDEKEQAKEFFKLDSSRKTILVIGGSLGARTINEAIKAHSEAMTDSGLQIIWQTGKAYYDKAVEFANEKPNANLHIYEFIYDMDWAYAGADIIISRAGAMSISELCMVGKPAILIPSPNVAEDHQTANAKALSSVNAAILIPDADAKTRLLPELLDLAKDDVRQMELSENILKLAKPHATREIAAEVLSLIKM